MLTIEKQVQNLEADRLVEILDPILRLLLVKLERVAFVHNLLVSVLTAGRAEPEEDGTSKEREMVRPMRGRSQSSVEPGRKQELYKSSSSPTLGRRSTGDQPVAGQSSEQENAEDEESAGEQMLDNSWRAENEGRGLNKWLQKVNLEITEEYKNQVCVSLIFAFLRLTCYNPGDKRQCRYAELGDRAHPRPLCAVDEDESRCECKTQCI